MHINFQELDHLGFNVELTKNQTGITIFPRKDNEEVRNRIKEIAEFLDFSGAECDELQSDCHRICIVAAIRKASRW